MMGQHARSEALFYYFRLEDQIPENHLLRLMHTPIRPALVGPRWFAGSTLRFSADNRAFVVRTQWGRSTGCYSPVLALGKLLTVVGLMHNTTGALEVTLAGGEHAS